MLFGVRLWSDIFLKFMNYRKAGRPAEARDALLAIRKLYENENVKPAFLSNFDRVVIEIEDSIEELLEDKFLSVQRGLEEASAISGSERRLARLVELYGVTRRILLTYKHLAKAMALKDDVLKELIPFIYDV